MEDELTLWLNVIISSESEFRQPYKMLVVTLKQYVALAICRTKIIITDQWLQTITVYIQDCHICLGVCVVGKHHYIL